ncbi:MAG TPA: hypothetical protein PKD72_12240, partial [Gemmatales bacterium]|nr:hypothetical protein [Gemmatales bacterium]
TYLAKRYGIVTPYTSYLVIPDEVPGLPRPLPGSVTGSYSTTPFPGTGGTGAIRPETMRERRGTTSSSDALKLVERNLDASRARSDVYKASESQKTLENAQEMLRFSNLGAVQQGKLGVDLSEQWNALKNQTRQSSQAQRVAYGRNCLEIQGVWVDEHFKKDIPTRAVKTMSRAYFRILDLQPRMKEVFALGQSVIWITPSGMALVIDPNEGSEDLTDEEINKLFKLN